MVSPEKELSHLEYQKYSTSTLGGFSQHKHESNSTATNTLDGYFK